MRNVFFISDHHLGQESFLSYLDDQGNKVRPFDSIEEMHEKIIDCHNSVVGKYDKVYFLGDWVDEYCDLTFDKMVNEIKSKKSIDPTRTITLPENLEDLKTKLKALNKSQATDFTVISDQLFMNGITIQGGKQSTGFFKNIRTFFSKFVK